MEASKRFTMWWDFNSGTVLYASTYLYMMQFTCEHTLTLGSMPCYEVFTMFYCIPDTNKHDKKVICQYWMRTDVNAVNILLGNNWSYIKASLVGIWLNTFFEIISESHFNLEMDFTEMEPGLFTTLRGLVSQTVKALPQKAS